MRLSKEQKKERKKGEDEPNYYLKLLKVWKIRSDCVVSVSNKKRNYYVSFLT